MKSHYVFGKGGEVIYAVEGGEVTINKTENEKRQVITLFLIVSPSNP
jgi:hypothetical protein